jgi:hypothetical protein
MSIYSGNKSLDAEIEMDFTKGKIKMDYSLNVIGDPYSSNSSVTIKNDFNNPSLKIYEFVRRLAFMIAILAYTGTGHLMTFCIERGWIKNKNYQVEHQKILKYIVSNTFGVKLVTIEAPIFESEVVYRIPNNLYFNYKLYGECESEIEKISLKRHFEKSKYFEKYNKIQQHGWDVIFNFRKPPQTGKCIIEYTTFH